MEILKFSSEYHLTLGVEIELQLINKNNFNLSSQAKEIINLIPEKFKTKIRHEVFQSMLEVTTSICFDNHEVSQDLRESFKLLLNIADTLNIELNTAATHPFSDYNDNLLYPSKRYEYIMEKYKWIAKRIGVYGMHVHLGMKDQETCINYYNFILQFLPFFLALSTSSPFWQGRDTGLASCRSTIFESAPTSGHSFPLYNWSDFEQIYRILLKSNSITTFKDLWWDVRPRPDYGTLEIRICDGLTNIKEILAVVAFIHLLAKWYNENETENNYHSHSNLPIWLIRENKWRVIRKGLNATIADIEGNNIEINEFFEIWIKRLDKHIKELKYEGYVEDLRKMYIKGNSTERQRAIYYKNNSLKDIVNHNCKEFEAGYPIYS